jgi:hypothetical protein
MSALEFVFACLVATYIFVCVYHFIKEWGKSK